MSQPDESPYADMHVFPARRSYAVIYIDPYATLEDELSSDDVPHSQELENIMNRKYVGLIEDWLDLYMDDRPHHRWQVSHIRKGPNPAFSDEKEHVDSTMCIPVSHSTENPTPWTPLELSKPLPWQNCFHYSHYSYMEVRHATTRSKELAPYTLPLDEFFRFEDIRMEHYSRSNAFKEERVPSGVGPQPPLHDYNNSPYKHINECLDGDLLPIVKFSYDLDTLEDFDDPFQYYSDVTYLSQLIKELKQNAIEKARKMDEQTFPEKKPQLPSQNPANSILSASVKSRFSGMRHKFGKVFRLSTLVSVLTCGLYHVDATSSPISHWGSVSSYSANSDAES